MPQEESIVGCRLGAALASAALSTVEILPGDGREWLPSASDTEPQDDSEFQERDFLFIEGNLGVPQKVLYKAYLQASPLLIRLREQLSTTASTSSTHASVVETLAWTSSVSILANPGHQTAWNVRKRLVERGFLETKQDLLLTGALLTVRDCAKQSLLWHHRRWLLRRCSPLSPHTQHLPASGRMSTNDEDTLLCNDLSVSLLRRELDACTVAANTYERNYFAWSHRFRCLEALVTAKQLAAEPEPHSKLLFAEVASVTLWIERHVADYSAMQYRCRLAFLIDFTIDTPHPSLDAPCFSHAKSLVEAYPEHEALWHYLRGALSLGSLPDPSVAARIDEMGAWGDSYLQATNALVHRNARVFFSWLSRQRKME